MPSTGKLVEVALLNRTNASAQRHVRMQHGQLSIVEEQKYLLAEFKSSFVSEELTDRQEIRLRKAIWICQRKHLTWDLCLTMTIEQKRKEKYSSPIPPLSNLSYVIYKNEVPLQRFMRRRGTLKGDVYEMIFGNCCRCISYKGIILPMQLFQGGADWWITSLRSSARARPRNTDCMRAALWEPSAAGAWGPHSWTVTCVASLSGTGKNTFPWVESHD